MLTWRQKLLARLLGPDHPGVVPRSVLTAQIDELQLRLAELEQERDYWRGRMDETIRRAEVAEDQVEDIRRLAEREKGRG